MKKHLIFISSPKEIDYIQKLTLGLGRNNKNQIILICNNTETLFRLKQLNIPAINSQKYFPRGNKLRLASDQVIKISRRWTDQPSIRKDIIYRGYNLGKIVGYSLYLHLSECQHGLMTAANIIEQIKPNIIHVSPQPTESQLKKYQSGKLNCENLALIEIARQNNIELRYIKPDLPVELINAIKVSTSYFLRYLKHSLKQLQSSSPAKFESKLFILANHYHLTNIQPLIKYLSKTHTSYDLFGKTDNLHFDELKKQNVKLNQISSLLPLKANWLNLKLINLIKYLFLCFKHLKHLKGYYNSINPNLWPLIKWKFFYLYTIQFPEIIETLDLADNLFSSHPRLFLTAATADIFNKCFAISARKNKVRTIELNHGLIIYDEEAVFRCNDLLAVWGPVFKKIIKKDKIAITGHPLFDNPTQSSQINKLNISGRKKYHLGLDKKVLLVLSALPIASDRLISNQSEYSFLKTIFDSLAATKKPWTVIFRTHPSNDVDWLNQIPAPPNINLISDFRHIPLNEAVATSDLIIANLTTALIEGIFQNKPVLVYPFLDAAATNLKSHPLIISGAVQAFRNSKQLARLLLTAPANINHKQQQNISRFLQQYCSLPAKISASQKLYNIIQKELVK